MVTGDPDPELDSEDVTSAPFISVVICTRNRAASLARTLESLAGSRVTEDVAWEVVVIDNGSTDATPDVIAAKASQLRICGHVEPEPGLSWARNRGVAEARGTYIIWTDDDVTVEPDWLQTYIEAFRADPDALVFGGAIRPVFEGSPPRWLNANRAQLRYLLAECSPLEPTTFGADDAELPYGANFAVRAAEQRACLYDTQLGASPAFNRLGEEELVIRALLKRGGHGRWTPGAVVNHHIPPSRQTLAYVIKYAKAGGETWAYQQQKSADRPTSRFRLAGVPAWVIRTYLTDYVAYQFYRLIDRPERWLPRLCSHAYCAGAASYILGQDKP